MAWQSSDIETVMKKTVPFLPGHEESDPLLMKKWADVKLGSWREWSSLVGMENVQLGGEGDRGGQDLWWHLEV